MLWNTEYKKNKETHRCSKKGLNNLGFQQTSISKINLN